MGSQVGHTITTSAVVLGTGAVFIAGAAASWLAFGAPRGVDLVADSGSTADWVAATGTCVIGAAAALVAWRQGHVSERNRLASEDRVRASAQAKLIQISQLIGFIPDRNPRGGAVLSDKRRLLAAKRLLAKCEFDADETRVLGEAALRMYAALRANNEVAILTMDAAIEREDWNGSENINVKGALNDAGAIAVKMWTLIGADRGTWRPVS